jgi:hypothetical protein
VFGAITYHIKNKIVEHKNISIGLMVIGFTILVITLALLST